ncbi:MAG: carboxymuconolactone decarboxylase family protein [Longimicrobiales bacterium]
MDKATRALVRVSAAIARHDRGGLVGALEDAAVTATARQVEETLLQSHLFVGYPAMMQALALWRDRAGAPDGDHPAEDPAEWERRGEEVCVRVYGGQYRRLRENVARLHPELERWMVVDGYGRVLGRPGLDLATRELCIVGLLCAQDAPRQLYSHLRGALNAGADPATVETAVREATTALPAERVDAAWRTWRSVTGRTTGGNEE